jgi:hypothetical protein
MTVAAERWRRRRRMAIPATTIAATITTAIAAHIPAADDHRGRRVAARIGGRVSRGCIAIAG